MSSASATQMGNDSRANVLPVATASGPGFLGPNYNPGDELTAPAQIGVRRGDTLDSVLGAVKGIVYYTDMIGFGESSNPFTKGMPGLKPLGGRRSFQRFVAPARPVWRGYGARWNHAAIYCRQKHGLFRIPGHAVYQPNFVVRAVIWSYCPSRTAFFVYGF